MDFDKAFELVIGHEGKFTKNRKDKGNWTGGDIGKGLLKGTKYGISAAAYPHLDIVNIDLITAKSIYLKDFWGKLQMEKMPKEITFDIFDTAVNSGVSESAVLLQRTLGLTEDGKIGNTTLLSASSIPPVTLKLRFNAQRLKFLAGLKGWDEFSEGWANRIANNMLLSE